MYLHVFIYLRLYRADAGLGSALSGFQGKAGIRSANVKNRILLVEVVRTAQEEST